MSSTTPQVIGVIICSSRKPRACPQIAAFVNEVVETALSSKPHEANQPPLPVLKVIDLAAWDLPMFDEPKIPSQVHSASDYGQAHTREWSLEIQAYSAFIFVTPQYNWGYPAVLKNSIDYLFNEWKAKPAMIVSYGGHGGGKCAAQLRQVLQGVDMHVAETMPALTFPSRATMVQAAKGEEICLSGEGAIWASERPVITKAFEELMDLMPKLPQA